MVLEYMKRSREIFILILMLITLISLNYSFFDKKLEGFVIGEGYVEVTRIIDGDTIEVDDNETIRLLGINTPERGEKYYKEAKEFLEMVLMNKTIKLEFGKDKKDKYGRTLAYIFRDSSNVNKELVDEGYANYYFPSGKDMYYGDFRKAWEHCLTNNKFLCEKSSDECSQCIEIKDSSIINSCSFSCNITNWQIKGEGRKKYEFKEALNPHEEAEFNSTGFEGSLFLRDEEGKLVVWEK